MIDLPRSTQNSRADTRPTPLIEDFFGWSSTGPVGSTTSLRMQAVD